MKTTLDLPDDLLIEAKTIAARQRTTLKAIVEHALRRELGGAANRTVRAAFTHNEHGFPVLKKTGQTPVTSETVYRLLDESES